MRKITLHNKLLIAVVIIFLLSVVSTLALWTPIAKDGQAQQNYLLNIKATVTSVQLQNCQGSTEDRLPSGEIPQAVQCVQVQAEITSSDDKGKVISIIAPALAYNQGLEQGSKILVDSYFVEGQEDVYSWNGFDRSVSLVVLLVIFALFIFIVGRWKGLSALVGLGFSFLIILAFVLPALANGKPAIAVGLSGSVLVMCCVLYFSHGINIKTTTALLGTIASLILTAVLSTSVVELFHFSGVNSEEDGNLLNLTGLPSLSGLVIAGIIIAGVGVLNDVTITQSSAVWELKQHAPELKFDKLFAAGMRVGRDHLASTIYTIAFAYAGTALPILLLLSSNSQSYTELLTNPIIIEEIVRSVVVILGLVAAIPLTTAITAYTAATSQGKQATENLPPDSHLHS